MDDKIIRDIVADLDLGMKCFIHVETKEIKVIPDTNKYYGADLELWSDVIEEIDNNLDKYYEIGRMHSSESFRLMKDFIDIVDNEFLKEKLINALNRPKPFKNFNLTIDNSGKYREMWFKFKDQQLAEWVEFQLKQKGLY